MNLKRTATSFLVASGLLVSVTALAHCQIPCGIYGDEARFEEMREHATTIEKSMNQIIELGRADKPDYNQLVRWVTNKEQHAEELSRIVTYYFLAQRIKKPEQSQGKEYQEYLAKLEVLHEIMTVTMKCKQTTDLDNVTKLRQAIQQFEHLYLGDRGHKH